MKKTILGTLTALGLVLAACGPPQTLPGEARYDDPEPQVRESLPSVLNPADPVPPGLQATVSGGVSDTLVRSARIVPGVAKATRVTLGKVVIHGDAGPSIVSVVAVDPTEYRDLAPEITSRADFVWEGLIQRRIFLAHEEQRRLGATPGENIAVEGPAGRILLRIGGVVANGSPNLGGLMMSLDRAQRLGLGEPNLLVVAVDEESGLNGIKEKLEGKLDGVNFGFMPRSARAFLAGPIARERLSFSFTSNPDGTITPDPAWVANNIVTTDVPILGSVRCNKIMIPQFRAALNELQQRGLAHTIETSEYAGCYVPRFIGRDPNKPLSMHAWGLAADINAASNPMGAPSKQDPKMVAVFESWGFRWGGRWSPPDAHHFELAGLVL